MIALLGASALVLSALQASITAPTDSFRGCLREAISKAKSERIAGDGIEAYLKTACTGQMGTLKSALISFRMKNGMSQKAAAADANMTVEDYIATPADNYKFLAEMNAPKVAPAPAATTPAVVTQAAAPSQPPKP
jgi:hypothetical protein